MSVCISINGSVVRLGDSLHVRLAVLTAAALSLGWIRVFDDVPEDEFFNPEGVEQAKEVKLCLGNAEEVGGNLSLGQRPTIRAKRRRRSRVRHGHGMDSE